MTFSNLLARGRAPFAIAAMAVSSAMLAGCMGSPTYGTDKTANQQLVEDLSGILSLTPKKRDPIDYKPRPQLVKPDTTAVLPPPQSSVTTASNGAWPQSPEQRLARVRADATEGTLNPAYRVETDIVPVRAETVDTPQDFRQQREAFKQALAAQKGVTPQRRYLSDPPLDYRQPAATAPTDDLGEDEWKKERDAKRASREASGKGRSWLPW